MSNKWKLCGWQESSSTRVFVSTLQPGLPVGRFPTHIFERGWRSVVPVIHMLTELDSIYTRTSGPQPSSCHSPLPNLWNKLSQDPQTHTLSRASRLPICLTTPALAPPMTLMCFVCMCVCSEVRGQLVGVGSPSTIWVPRTEFRLAALVEGAFTCLSNLIGPLSVEIHFHVVSL